MKKNLIYLILIIASISVNAHPHIFVDALLLADFTDNGLKGVEIRWVYDEMYSATIEMITGRFGVEKFTEEEIELLRQEEFELMKKNNYNTKIKIDGENYPVNKVENFKARKYEDFVVFSFYIPLNIEFGEQYREIRISLYDKEYYTEYYLIEPDPIIFRDASNYEADYYLEYNEEEAYYFDQIYPQEIIIDLKKKAEEKIK